MKLPNSNQESALYLQTLDTYRLKIEYLKINREMGRCERIKKLLFQELKRRNKA